MTGVLEHARKLTWREFTGIGEAAMVLCRVAFGLRRSNFAELVRRLHLDEKMPAAGAEIGASSAPRALGPPTGAMGDKLPAGFGGHCRPGSPPWVLDSSSNWRAKGWQFAARPRLAGRTFSSRCQGFSAPASCS